MGQPSRGAARSVMFTCKSSSRYEEAEVGRVCADQPCTWLTSCAVSGSATEDTRRPVTAGEIKLVGKESNRLEDRFTGLLTIDELDERLTVYHDNDGWRRRTLPKLQAMGSKKVAEAVGMSERRARDILKGRAMPHPRHHLAMKRLSEGANSVRAS